MNQEERNIFVCENCAKCSTSLSGEYCDFDEHKIINVMTEGTNCNNFSMLEQDSFLEEIWKELGDVPMNPETECIETDFKGFKSGTNREIIWHWFDKLHSKGIGYLMNNC